MSKRYFVVAFLFIFNGLQRFVYFIKNGFLSLFLSAFLL